MYSNPEYPAGVVPLAMYGTNSTIFTACCETAICSDEKYCPSCKRVVIGANAKTNHEREMIRWKSATALWPRKR